ncbi:MAG: ABC transporter permease [Lewinellaceae bacterium]|nr:ABC transporter permease [Lewinellaceae bacterium]
MLVGGLAAGLTACLLLLQYVSYELSFDHFHTKADRIFRVVNERFQEGKSIQKGTITYPTIGAAMAKDFPEVANHTRIMAGGDVLVRLDDKIAEQKGLLWADEHFFEIFDFPLLAREGRQLIDESNEVAISRSVAGVYFPLGERGLQRRSQREIYLSRKKPRLRSQRFSKNCPPIRCCNSMCWAPLPPLLRSREGHAGKLGLVPISGIISI